MRHVVFTLKDKLTTLIESGKYDTTDDFTVVLQPFFTETNIPLTEVRHCMQLMQHAMHECNSLHNTHNHTHTHTAISFFCYIQEGIPDNSYFSLDCFHFSPKGHAIGARYVWNNMVPKS